MPPFSASTTPLVAPLWADFDFRDTGSVYHRVSRDDYILDKAASRIAAMNPDLASYRPTLCVIATWFQATLFSDTLLDSEVKNCNYDQ